MNTTIWKFQLAVEDEQVIRLPRGAEVLTVQAQNGAPMLWALVDPDAAVTDPLRLSTRGTGHDTSSIGRYLGTYQLEEGRFVGHVFEAAS